MRTFFIFTALLVVASAVFADSAEQTSWSGGPGVTGPVPQFGNTFKWASSTDWSRMPGALTLSKTLIGPGTPVNTEFYGAHAVQCVDVNGDGDLDIIAAANTLDEISWWENETGAGTVWTKHLIDGTFEFVWSVYGEDIDGDGDIDVAGAAFGSDQIAWWENENGQGTAWEEHLIDGNFDGASSVYADDVDGDGNMDILGTARTADDVVWWENANGSGTSWVKHYIHGDYNGARSVVSGDIDGDGDTDVLTAAVTEDRVTWWENNNQVGTAWSRHDIASGFDGACSVCLDDIDGDGDMDAAGAAVHQNAIAWWENDDGTGGSWTAHTVNANFEGAHSVSTADLDNDGNIDVFGAAEIAYDVTWWQNMDGTGTTWTGHLIDSNFMGASWVCSGDLNDDGWLEIVAAAKTGNDIIQYNRREYNLAGSLESSILDTETLPVWDFVEWNANTPTTTSVYLQVRASDNPQSMGPWSAPIMTPTLLGAYLDDGDRYVQYRVSMSTQTPSVTPRLYDMMLTWDHPQGTGEGEPLTVTLLPFEPNPSNGSPLIRFGLPGTDAVTLTVYDLSGRMVTAIPAEEYGPGYHEVQLDGLASGVYFCRMVSGDLSEVGRFTVLE